MNEVKNGEWKVGMAVTPIVPTQVLYVISTHLAEITTSDSRSRWTFEEFERAKKSIVPLLRMKPPRGCFQRLPS